MSIHLTIILILLIIALLTTGTCAILRGTIYTRLMRKLNRLEQSVDSLMATAPLPERTKRKQVIRAKIDAEHKRWDKLLVRIGTIAYIVLIACTLLTGLRIEQ